MIQLGNCDRTPPLMNLCSKLCSKLLNKYNLENNIFSKVTEVEYKYIHKATTVVTARVNGEELICHAFTQCKLPVREC